MVILYHILFGLFGLVDGCVRTADTGTATTLPPVVTTTVAGTTVVPTTTTTLGTTTTTAACNSCMASQVALGPDPDDGDMSHSPTSMPGPSQNGCSTLIITCTPMGNPESLMTFQNGLGGPAPGNPATATLVCNNMGQYQLEDLNGPAVTAAHCLG